MDPETAASESAQAGSAWIALRNALAMPLMGSVMAIACFVWLGNYLPRHLDLYHAAIVQFLSFAVGLAIIFAVVVAWQRARGMSLAELGWRKPTTPLALILALVLGALFTVQSYFGAQFLLRGVDVLEFNWVRLALAPVGIFMAIAEETMMRGFFMTELQRARVAVWVQILASGACSAVYHCFQNPTLMGFLPSFVLFSMHAGLYVLGRRSLTPVILAHSIYHVLGEPYILMMAMVVMNRG
jgi:membrane protease YdiL (CAAX protease family)